MRSTGRRRARRSATYAGADARDRSASCSLDGAADRRAAAQRAVARAPERRARRTDPRLPRGQPRARSCAIRRRRRSARRDHPVRAAAVGRSSATVDARASCSCSLGVLGGSGARAARRAGGRAPRDGADRRADRDGAREIARTRDPGRARAPAARPTTRSPSWRARSRGCSRALDAARGETEATLARQRAVRRRRLARAAHAADERARQPRAARPSARRRAAARRPRSALRSSQRMRRLVADLLLLARADAGRERAARARSTSRRSLVEAAGELGPLVSGDHDDRARRRSPAVVDGRARRAAPARAQPDRERAAPHAAGHARPRRASRARRRRVVLVVEDDGPGIPAELRDARVRALRARRRRPRRLASASAWRSCSAVAESHGGSVALRDAGDARAGRALRRARCRSPPAAARRTEAATRPARDRPRAMSARLARLDLDDDRQHHRPAPAGGRRRTRRGRRAGAPGAGRSRGSPPRRRARATSSTASRISSTSSSASSRNGTPRKMTSGVGDRARRPARRSSRRR